VLVFVFEIFFYKVMLESFILPWQVLTTTVLNHADINALAFSSLVLCGVSRVLLPKMLISSLMCYPMEDKEPSINNTVFYRKKELGCILKFLKEFYFSKMWKSSSQITKMFL